MECPAGVEPASPRFADGCLTTRPRAREAPRAGIEPAPSRLTAGRAAVTPPRKGASRRSRTASPAYRAGALPEGIERRRLRDQESNLESAGSEPAVLPVTPSRIGSGERSRTSTDGVQSAASCRWTTPEQRSGRRDSNPHGPAWKAGARPSGGGRVVERVTGVEPAWYSLGSCCLASSASPASSAPGRARTCNHRIKSPG